MIPSFFKDGDTFFSVSDSRHWFYQLTRSKGKRPFSLLFGIHTYQFKAWLMGFSWSPFVAQAHSMAIAKVGIGRCKDLHAVPPLRKNGTVRHHGFCHLLVRQFIDCLKPEKRWRRNPKQQKGHVCGSGGKMESIIQFQREKFHIRDLRVHHSYKQSRIRIPRLTRHY